MAPDSLNDPQISAFPANKLAPLLRALADPEGRDELPPEQEATIRQIEANAAQHP